jgi:hypothetical protein
MATTMGDMVEDYAAMRKQSQERRANNRDSSAQILTSKGVIFTSNNGGAHLIIRYGSGHIDFWPGTGKWIVRGSDVKGRGVFELLKHWGVK